MEGGVRSRNPADEEDLPKSKYATPLTLLENTAVSADVLPAAGQASLSISTSTGLHGSKKLHLTAFIFDLLLVKAPPEHKLQMSVFILFLPLLESKGGKTLNSSHLMRVGRTTGGSQL